MFSSSHSLQHEIMVFHSFISVSKAVHLMCVCGYSAHTSHAGADSARGKLQWSTACSKYVCLLLPKTSYF